MYFTPRMGQKHLKETDGTTVNLTKNEQCKYQSLERSWNSLSNEEFNCQRIK